MSESQTPKPARDSKYFRGRIPETELRRRYEVRRQSTAEIASAFGCSKQKVRTDLAHYGIPLRPTST